MAQLERTMTIDDITPEEMAKMFLSYGDEEQARFFNSMKAITDQWHGTGWCGQCSWITQHLDNDGREIIAKLADWSANP